MADIHKLVGEVAARNRIRIDEDDPIFAVSTINRLMLDEAVEALLERVRETIGEFETTAKKVDALAGKALAEEVRKSAAAWKQEIAKDINAANLRSTELVNTIQLAQSLPFVIRWASLGIAVGLVLFGCGFWAATCTH